MEKKEIWYNTYQNNAIVGRDNLVEVCQDDNELPNLRNGDSVKNYEGTERYKFLWKRRPAHFENIQKNLAPHMNIEKFVQGIKSNGYINDPKPKVIIIREDDFITKFFKKIKNKFSITEDKNIKNTEDISDMFEDWNKNNPHNQVI